MQQQARDHFGPFLFDFGVGFMYNDCIVTTQFALQIDPTLCNPNPNPNPPPNLTLCESILGSGSATFNFTPQTAIVLGANNPANYTISYHLTQAAADGDTGAISPISAFINTSNPQTIYVRMEENANPLTFGTTTFQLIVNPLPSATISGTTSICSGTNTVITFNGTPNATVTYSVNAGPNQTIVLNGAGTNTITTPNLSANTTYGLVSVLNTATTCSRTIVGSATVTVNPLPTATISGTATICSGGTTTITFSGTPDATVTYTINGGANQTIVLNGTGAASISTPVLTANTTYNLVSVLNSSTSCSQPQSGSAVVTITTAPTIFAPSNYVVCDDSNNNDGLYCAFDLTTRTNQITGGNPNIVVTYHETLTNSQTGANPLIGLYCSNSALQTIYVRAYILGSPACYTTTTFNLIVNPLPLANPVITDYALCDDNNPPGVGQEIFTLNTKTAEIANGQANVTVSYYDSQPNATSQISPLPNSHKGSAQPLKAWATPATQHLPSIRSHRYWMK